MDLSYAAVPRALVADRFVTHHGARLYAVLTRYANTDRQAWPSQRTLSEEMDCSIRQVERSVAVLRDSGWVTVERRWPGGPNRYTLRLEPTFLDPESDPEEGEQEPEENDCGAWAEDDSTLTPPDKDGGTHPTGMAALSYRYKEKEENLAARVPLRSDEAIEDGFDPAKTCGLFDTLAAPAPAKTPGARALAIELRSAWMRERPAALAGDINVAAVSGQMASWMRTGVSAAELRSMINLFVEVKGFQAEGIEPWRCFLARRHTLLQKVRTTAEAQRAENDPEYWKPAAYDWREESARWLAEQAGGMAA